MRPRSDADLDAKPQAAMEPEHLDSLEDPRLALYRNLKDRELARQGDRFIAEGEFVVRRMIAAGWPVESLLLAQRKLAGMQPVIPADTPTYVVSDSLMEQILGFEFHSGVIAVGRRRSCTSLRTVLESKPRLTLLVCPQVINHENVGSLMRIAAAFGVDAFVLGPESCDPFWRRSVRVSMGAVFSLTLVRPAPSEWSQAMQNLREAGVQLIATVLDENATPLEKLGHPGRLAIFVGSESQGLDAATLAHCHQRVTIPMQLGTDSLNVSIATAVTLYHFTRVASGAAD